MDIYEYYQRNLMIEQSIFEANYICEYRLALADTVPINEGIGDIFSVIIDFIGSIIEKIRNMFSAVADFFRGIFGGSSGGGSVDASLKNVQKADKAGTISDDPVKKTAKAKNSGEPAASVDKKNSKEVKVQFKSWTWVIETLVDSEILMDDYASYVNNAMDSCVNDHVSKRVVELINKYGDNIPDIEMLKVFDDMSSKMKEVCSCEIIFKDIVRPLKFIYQKTGLGKIYKCDNEQKLLDNLENIIEHDETGRTGSKIFKGTFTSVSNKLKQEKENSENLFEKSIKQTRTLIESLEKTKEELKQKQKEYNTDKQKFDIFSDLIDVNNPIYDKSIRRFLSDSLSLVQKNITIASRLERSICKIQTKNANIIAQQSKMLEDTSK